VVYLIAAERSKLVWEAFTVDAIGCFSNAEVTRVALINAARRGRLQAVRQANGQWQSTRKWVQEYQASRHQRSQDSLHLPGNTSFSGNVVPEIGTGVGLL